MAKHKKRSHQLYKHSQRVDYRHRLRRALIEASARFLEQNPQWGEFFFDLDFLLNHGLPIVERHIAGATSSGAIDLALAWAEGWPEMNASQRKVCLQAQTVIASELLRLVTEEMVRARAPHAGSRQEEDAEWHGVGIPLAYVKAHNPPGRAIALQRHPLHEEGKEVSKQAPETHG